MIGRLNYFLGANGQIPPQQYVFTTAKSTADAINAVMEFFAAAANWV
jgi:hypothetical protein